MDQACAVKLALNSQVYEINYNWKIPEYSLENTYSENFKLKDDLECTIMLKPEKFYGRNIPYFVRSHFTVLFTKVPTESGRETWFNYRIKSNTDSSLSIMEFRKVKMTTEGFVGIRNNLSSASWKKFIDKDSSLNMNITFIIDDLFNIENFAKGDTPFYQDFSYDNIQYTDMKLVCSNDEKLPANKAILAARSPIFAKALTNEMDTYIIEQNVSMDNVLAFLQFLYTDTISADKFDANEMLQLASKYEVSDLIKICQQYLFHECKTGIEEISMKLGKITCEEMVGLDNYTEINHCIKNLQKCIKNISIN